MALNRRHRWRLPAGFAVCAIVLGGCFMLEEPSRSTPPTDEETIALIDSMRDKGSYEDARERLNASARAIAEQIVAAVPGQSWQFSDDPNVQEVKRNGLPCKDLRLTGSVALRPTADTVAFGRTFTSEEFAVAADIVRREAAKYGVTDESSLFDEQSRRDYAVQGNGYEFQLMQINRARLNITGDCFLMQRVLDLPPGQLPPKPPLTTTSR
ncbi:LppA family lipoprotein [Mycolicibacterium phlei]|uniref:LppA family lipoprotein n=1 Tax=Mycolicibacterium phlei TaxID=1771 RepID=UPI000DA1F54C|nr:LppA family lipoprotein [Mycolicibacterium phlei]